MAQVTSMKITTDPRDRLRALGAKGDTLEDVVLNALDVYESQTFWAAAELATAVETPEQRGERRRIESEADAWLDPLC